jgi:bacteriocin-type signal sequence|nr:bacteriocin [uncultured Neisseria sp.]
MKTLTEKDLKQISGGWGCTLWFHDISISGFDRSYMRREVA